MLSKNYFNRGQTLQKKNISIVNDRVQKVLTYSPAGNRDGNTENNENTKMLFKLVY